MPKTLAVLALFTACGGLTACGGATTPVEAPPTTGPQGGVADAASARHDGSAKGDASAASDGAPPSEGSTSGANDPGALPTSCAAGSSSSVCLPPLAYAKALCNEDHPTLALAMFQKGTPWTRGYSMTKSAAWNASGGASSNEPMAMYEELLVLRERKNTTGIEVSGAGTSYDVLRWDGSCVTLQAGEFVFDRPGKVTSAPIVWKRLEEHVRDALKEAEALRPIYLAHRRECKGATMGSVTKECEKLDREFSRAIAAYVREKGGVPLPKRLPKP